MKNVVLIGASGFVGTAILSELLNRGNRVTAIVRNPEKVTIADSRLSVVKADVSDVEKITATCKGKDAVISAYNPGWANPNIYEETLKKLSIDSQGGKNYQVLNVCFVSVVQALCFAPGVESGRFGCYPRRNHGWCEIFR